MKVVRGASACLVDAEGSIMLIHREKEPFRDRLAFPGGGVEEGETPLEAARRELREETGHVASLDPIASVHVEVERGDTRYAIDCFAFGSWTSGTGPLAPEWLTIDEALARDLVPGVAEAIGQMRESLERHFAPRSPTQ